MLLKVRLPKTELTSNTPGDRHAQYTNTRNKQAQRETDPGININAHSVQADTETNTQIKLTVKENQ